MKLALTKQDSSKCFKDAGQNKCLSQSEYFSSNGSSKRVCDIICSNSKCQNKRNNKSNDNHPYLVLLETYVVKHIRMK